MELCISAQELRRALAEIESAEQHGFHHCLAVFRITSAGQFVYDCQATYSDLLERAHPTDPRLNWGRFQSVSQQCYFRDGRLVPIVEGDVVEGVVVAERPLPEG